MHAAAERVYAALWTADLAPLAVRLLTGARALPAVIVDSLGFRRAGRSRRRRGQRSTTLRDTIARGFSLVAEERPRELVLGVVGAFWRLRGDLRPVTAASFRERPPAGTARAAWSFSVTQRTDGTCLLATETRVECGDAASRRRFALYWFVVRPGSGLIRRAMLRSIRRAAEG